MLLDRMPIDLIEKIVVCTCSYHDYKTLCEIIKKLKETQIRLRIIGKLTVKTVSQIGNVYYTLGKYQTFYFIGFL